MADFKAPLPNEPVEGEKTHIEDHERLIALIEEIRDIINGVETTANEAKDAASKPAEAVAWDDIEDKPSTFAPALGTTDKTALAGDTPLLKLGTTATTALKGDTKIPAATAVGTADQLKAGTDTTARAWSAKDLAATFAPKASE